MATWGSRLRALSAVAALLLSGCAAPGGEPWAAEAEAWFEGLDATFEEQERRHAYYYAPDAVNDSRMLAARHYTEGRWPTVLLQATSYAYENLFGPLYLSSGGAARSHIMVVDGDDGTTDVGVLLAHYEIGEDGIERHTHLAHTELDYTIRHGQDEAVALAEDVAAAYLAAWAGGGSNLVGDLYAAEAVVVDELRGLSARGRDEVATLAATSAPIVAQANSAVVPPRVLDLAPEVAPEVPAVLLRFDPDRARVPTQVWLLVRSQDRCPGSSVVALDLDDQQRVVAERRFAAPASVRACADPDALPTGWWTGRELPLPFSERITGSVRTARGAVEIRNGWPPADDTVRWAFGQYAAAGLLAPAVSTVTFDPLDERCQESPGHAEWSGGTTEVLICYDSSQTGGPGADGEADLPDRAQLLLHEIGHAWLVNYTDDDTREAFLAHVGVDNWNDKGRPWRERGVEWAAESLAWGLRGIATSSVPLGSPDCAILAEGYRILTAAEPLTTCPSSPA